MLCVCLREHSSDSHDIATPEIARQWEHLKTIADKIPYRPDIEIGMLIGRNIPSAFQPLNVIHGAANEPWAEEYKFGWTIIGPVCLADVETKECNLTVSVNRITVHREELPFHDSDRDLLQLSKVVDQNGFVTLLTSIKRPKDVTTPQQIHEMMELDYGELFHSRKIQSVEDKRFCQILSTGIYKNHLGNWEAPLPFRRIEVNLPTTVNSASEDFCT